MPGESSRQTIDVRHASVNERVIVHNLMQLHGHDMSEFEETDVNENGWFEYDTYEQLDTYWTDEKQHPFLLRVEGKIAGFALVRQEERDDQTPYTFMVDFFILNKYRRQGIGARFAHSLFDLFPGEWEVSELPRNLPAQSFWRTVIGRYTDGVYQEEELEWGDFLQSFNTKNHLVLPPQL